jgi:tetratricopeptide (TPR) repeat protein
LGMFTALLRIIKRAGIAFAFASPFMVLAALSIQSRFILRPHLFEYFFVIVLLGLLLGRSKKGGIRFYLWPVLLQLCWVNMHPSFILGPVIVLLIFLGESAAALLSKRWKSLKSPWNIEVRWKSFAALFALLVLVTLLTPSPYQFISQPLNAEQRDLITRYTLEWRSPFDPALADASFHPYYEIMLGMALLIFLISIPRLHISSLLLVFFFAGLSLYAHRFRVEFALVALPLLLAQWKHAPLTDRVEAFVSKKTGGLLVPRVMFGLLGCTLLFYAGRDRVEIGGRVSDRFPIQSLEFVLDEDIARRSYHTIGFGSFMLWKLYPERQSFIDGRNVSPDMYEALLDGQRDEVGFERVAKTYDLDGLILPPPERCDPGMRNVHRFASRSGEWALAHMDRNGYVYVKKSSVPAGWLTEKAYTHYHPVTYRAFGFSPEQVEPVVTEIRRAIREDSSYIVPIIDLGNAYAGGQRPREALKQFRKARALDSDHPEVLHHIGVLATQLGTYDEAVDALERLARQDPANPIRQFNLGVVYEAKRDTTRAITAYGEALELDNNMANAYVRLFDLFAVRSQWQRAGEIAARFYESIPHDYRSNYTYAVSLFKAGDLDQSLERATRAVQLKTDKAEGHALLARILFTRKEYRPAKEEAECALQLDHMNAEARRILSALETLGEGVK